MLSGTACANPTISSLAIVPRRSRGDAVSVMGDAVATEAARRAAETPLEKPTIFAI